MDSEKEKNRLSDIVLRVDSRGTFCHSVSPSLEPVVEIPSHGSHVRAGKVTGPEEYKRRFLVPAPRAAEWKTAYIDGGACADRHAGQGAPAAAASPVLSSGCWNGPYGGTEEGIASLLGEVYRPWDEDGQPGGTPRR